MSTEQPTTLADSILELEGPFTRPGTITLYFDRGQVLTLDCGQVNPVEFLWEQIWSLKVEDYPQVPLNAISMRASGPDCGWHSAVDRDGNGVGDFFPIDVPPPEITGLRSILKPEVCDEAGFSELPDCSRYGRKHDIAGGEYAALHQFIRDYNKFIEQH